MKKNTKQSFFEGTIILILSTIVVKILGAMFKIPLASILGGEGMGYFMTGYSIFAPVSAVALGGITVAMSKTISSYNALGRYKDSKTLLNLALFVFSLIGIIMGCLLYIASDKIGVLIKNPLSISVVKAMCPAVTLCFISSTLRGYFEGCKNIYPTALSQMGEAIVKLLCGYSGAVLAVRKGTLEYVEFGTIFATPAQTLDIAREILLPKAAAWAAYGVSISTAIGVLILLFCFKGNKQNNNNFTVKTSYSKLLSELFKTALPAGIGAVGANIPGIIDLFTIITSLTKAIDKNPIFFNNAYSKAIKSGVDLTRLPNFLYGAYTGMAVTLVSIIPAFVAPIGINALPLVSEAWASGNKQKLKENIEEILKLTAVIALPLGLGLAVVSDMVLTILFSNRINEAEIASSLLVFLAISAVFTAINIPITAILQGIGKANIPVKIMMFCGILKLILNTSLISMPYINIYGCAIATLICSILICLLSLSAFIKVSKIKINYYKTFGKPLFCGISCFLASSLAKDLLIGKINNIFLTITVAGVGAIIYILFVFLSGTISIKELENLSFLRKNKKALEKNIIIG